MSTDPDQEKPPTTALTRVRNMVGDHKVWRTAAVVGAVASISPFAPLLLIVSPIIPFSSVAVIVGGGVFYSTSKEVNDRQAELEAIQKGGFLKSIAKKRREITKLLGGSPRFGAALKGHISVDSMDDIALKQSFFQRIGASVSNFFDGLPSYGKSGVALVVAMGINVFLAPFLMPVLTLGAITTSLYIRDKEDVRQKDTLKIVEFNGKIEAKFGLKGKSPAKLAELANALSVELEAVKTVLADPELLDHVKGSKGKTTKFADLAVVGQFAETSKEIFNNSQPSIWRSIKRVFGFDSAPEDGKTRVEMQHYSNGTLASMIYSLMPSAFDKAPLEETISQNVDFRRQMDKLDVEKTKTKVKAKAVTKQKEGPAKQQTTKKLIAGKKKVHGKHTKKVLNGAAVGKGRRLFI